MFVRTFQIRISASCYLLYFFSFYSDFEAKFSCEREKFMKMKVVDREPVVVLKIRRAWINKELIEEHVGAAERDPVKAGLGDGEQL